MAPAPKKRSVWRNWWVWVLLLALILGVAALVLALTASDDGDSGSSTTTRPSGTTGPATTAPGSSAPATTVAGSTTVPPTTAPSANAQLGDIVKLDAGVVARVNQVLANAPQPDEFTEPDPGTSFARVDVEQCAGTEPLTVNPFYWSGQLDDNTTADVALGAQDFVSFDVGPNGCVRGDVYLTVPDGRTVKSVVLTDNLLSEVGRWRVSGAGSPPASPLAGDKPPTAAAIGEKVTVEDGSTAVVKST
ncbi:MAG TPA: hypothetical protein VF855_01770, partial [Acidimicrobiales bacterium]